MFVSLFTCLFVLCSFTGMWACLCAEKVSLPPIVETTCFQLLNLWSGIWGLLTLYTSKCHIMLLTARSSYSDNVARKHPHQWPTLEPTTTRHLTVFLFPMPRHTKCKFYIHKLSGMMPSLMENFTFIMALFYSASHTRVAPENDDLQKEQKYNTFACHTCNEVRLFCEFAKRKLATRKDKIR
jgi:hypothetical protein